MNQFIRPEFWVQCASCLGEVVMTANTPSTNRQPTTKAEAWEAAKSSGWSGSYVRPVCPECKS